MRKIKNIAHLMEKYYSYKITRSELRILLKYEPFGRVTGIVGPFVLRYRNNKLIISDRAIVYNASQSRESVENRNSFAASVKFARALYQIEAMKKIWQQSEADGTSTYHKILKQNKLTTGYPSIKNNITPGDNHFITEKLCSLNHQMNIVVSKDHSFHPDETLLIVIVPYDPVNVNDNAFEVINNSIGWAQSGTEISFTEGQFKILRRYKRYIIYTALIRVNGEKVQWSNTMVEQGSMLQAKAMVSLFFILSLAMLYSGIKKQYSYSHVIQGQLLFDG